MEIGLLKHSGSFLVCWEGTIMPAICAGGDRVVMGEEGGSMLVMVDWEIEPRGRSPAMRPALRQLTANVVSFTVRFDIGMSG